MVFKISSMKNSCSAMSVIRVAIPSEQMITKTRRVMLLHVQDREAKVQEVLMDLMRSKSRQSSGIRPYSSFIQMAVRSMHQTSSQKSLLRSRASMVV